MVGKIQFQKSVVFFPDDRAEFFLHFRLRHPLGDGRGVHQRRKRRKIWAFAAVVSIEAPGANDAGVYHNAGGMDVSVLEAKTDALWAKLRELGVPSVAIGDLGNEIGMGKIADHIRSFVPFTAHGECSCGCKGGILAQSTADSIITATCSDWGCYGLMAALAYLLRNIDILHTEEMEAEVMRAASRSGLIDMTGSLLPGIDGFNLKMNVSILSLMRQCTDYALRYSHRSDRWFGPVLEKHFFE